MSEGYISDVPDEIERVIEGGDIREISDNDNEDDKKEDENKEKEKEKIRKRTGPRIVLNPARLKGPRGLGIMETFFSDIKLHGKGREIEDLNLVMQRLEHWTHRLIPRMQFDDCLKKIEKLGSKKEISNYVKRIRLGMESDDVPNDVMEDTPDSPPPIEDPFDQLIGSTSGSAAPVSTEITSEQREQILRNRLLAEERRAARIKKAQEMKEKFLTAQSQCSQENAGIGQSNVTQFYDNNEKSTDNIHSADNTPIKNVTQPETKIGNENANNLIEDMSEIPSLNAEEKSNKNHNCETDKRSTELHTDNNDLLGNTPVTLGIQTNVDEESETSSGIPFTDHNHHSKSLETKLDILENESHKQPQQQCAGNVGFNEEMQVDDDETETINDSQIISASAQEIDEDCTNTHTHLTTSEGEETST